MRKPIPCGAWSRRACASTLGTAIAIVNMLLVVSALAPGAEIGEAIPWLIAPVMIIAYLLSSGRAKSARAFRLRS